MPLELGLEPALVKLAVVANRLRVRADAARNLPRGTRLQAEGHRLWACGYALASAGLTAQHSCVRTRVTCVPLGPLPHAHRMWLYFLGRLTRAARACRKKKTPTTLRTTKSIIRCGSGTRRSSEMTRAQRVQSGPT